MHSNFYQKFVDIQKLHHRTSGVSKTSERNLFETKFSCFNLWRPTKCPWGTEEANVFIYKNGISFLLDNKLKHWKKMLEKLASLDRFLCRNTKMRMGPRYQSISTLNSLEISEIVPTYKYNKFSVNKMRIASFLTRKRILRGNQLILAENIAPISRKTYSL